MEGNGNGGGTSDELLGHYKLGKTLGVGAFGKVKSAQHILTGKKVAIKILDRRKIKHLEMEEKVQREIRILKLFRHPHIIRLYEVIETPTNIYVVMEYVKSGELFEYILMKGRLPDNEARRFFQQIICGIDYCHRNRVAHRDLKPENLLIDSNFNIKIVDFGLSNVIRDDHLLKTACGSYNYAAPEVLSGNLYSGPGVDVWSCGVILYALLCATLPFDDASIPNLIKKIKCGMYALPSHLSVGAKDLISRMLVVDPVRRATISEICQHAWFRVQLPLYLAAPPPDLRQQVEEIDEEILEKVIRLGFERNQLIDFLVNRRQDEATVSYYLLLDSRIHGSKGNSRHEFQDGSVSHMHSSETATSCAHTVPTAVNNPETSSRPNIPDDSKWTLSIQSKSHPYEIMKEIGGFLDGLRVYCKNIGDCKIRCKWQPGVHDTSENCAIDAMRVDQTFNNEMIIVEKNDVPVNQFITAIFDIQLHRTADEKYVLHVQKIEGSQMLFATFCASLFSHLRVQ